MRIPILFRRRQTQRNITDEARKIEVRQALMNVLSEARDIEGILMIYSANGHIWVSQGGLQDDFEGIAYLTRATYLINAQGIPEP